MQTPGVWVLALQISPPFSTSYQVTSHKSLLIMCLRTLYLSLRSFSHPDPLFSIVCGLFRRNTGGCGVPSHSTAHKRELGKLEPTGEGVDFSDKACKNGKPTKKHKD